MEESGDMELSPSDIDYALMFELVDIGEEIPHTEENYMDLRAYAIAVTIAAVGKRISESLFSMYVCKLPIDEDILLGHTAWFLGADLLDIQCDCRHNTVDCLLAKIINSESFFSGRKAFKLRSDEYNTAEVWVAEMAGELAEFRK